MVLRPSAPVGRVSTAGWTATQLVLTAVSLATLLVGAFGCLLLLRAIGQPSPTEYTYDELLQSSVDGQWVRVVDGQLDFDTYIAETDSDETVERIYAPLRPPSWHRGPRPDDISMVSVVVAIEGEDSRRRSKTDDLVRGLGGVWVGGGERRVVDGTARVLRSLPVEDAISFRWMERTLPPRFILIDESDRPELGLAMALMLGSFVVGLLLYGLARALSPQRDYGILPWVTHRPMPRARRSRRHG